MDHRELVADTYNVLRDVNIKSMTANIYLEDDDGVEVPHQVNLKFDVCPTCEGKGHHVNPSIDSHGISTEEFAEDPDFREDYFSGAYDVQCYGCHGKNVVPVVDETTTPKDTVEQYKQELEYEYQAAAERAYERKMGY